MIYITQIIYLKEGKEATFQEFESFAIPLMEKYNGKMIHRIRPPKESFVDSKIEKTPYEIHFLSFNSESDLQAFLQDKDRQNLKHLKIESIESTFLVKGIEF